MRASRNAFIALCSILAITSCARITGQTAAEESQAKIDQVKKDIEDMRRQREEQQARADEAARKSQAERTRRAREDFERSQDLLSGGSQPGQILLYRALVDGVKPDLRITVTQTVGTGWRGQAAPLSPTSLVLRKDKVLSTLPDAIGTVTNFGCDLKEFSKLTEGLKTKAPIVSEAVTLASAEVVLVCDGTKLGTKGVTIHAGTLVIKNARIESLGLPSIGMIEIAAGALQLEGTNAIGTSIEDSVVTMFAAPSIAISAKKLSGEGTLALTSKGASYATKLPKTQETK